MFPDVSAALTEDLTFCEVYCAVCSLETRKKNCVFVSDFVQIHPECTPFLITQKKQWDLNIRQINFKVIL